MTKAPEQYDAHIRARAGALRSALPAEPPAEIIEVLEDAVWAGGADEDSVSVIARAAYRALRVHLLGEA